MTMGFCCSTPKLIPQPIVTTKRESLLLTANVQTLWCTRSTPMQYIRTMYVVIYYGKNENTF